MVLALLLSIAIIVFIISGISAKKHEIKRHKPVEKFDLNANESKLVELINNHRENKGLNKLIPELLASAICYEYVSTGEINHNAYTQRAYESRSIECDEIWGSNYRTPEEMFEAYLNSPKGHKRIIEKADRTHIGISYLNNNNITLILKY